MKKLVHDLPHYVSLLGILAVSAILFFIFSYDRNFQIAVSGALAVAYVVWGVVHHYIHRDLYLVVVFEYLTMAVLGFVIVLSVILRV